MPSNDPNVNFKSITENFLEATDKHAPLKKKLVRGNQAPFMIRDFQKAIYTTLKEETFANFRPNRESLFPRKMPK